MYNIDINDWLDKNQDIYDEYSHDWENAEPMILTDYEVDELLEVPDEV